ncbi:MAG TPA: hypothetical protein VGA92_00925 [Candidatus Nitrosotenuis sp.]
MGLYNMGLTESIKTITELLAELNKTESNSELKRVASALRKIQREMEKQQRNAKRDLRISIAITSVIAFVIGYALKYYF